MLLISVGSLLTSSQGKIFPFPHPKKKIKRRVNKVTNERVYQNVFPNPFSAYTSGSQLVVYESLVVHGDFWVVS